MEQMTNGYIIVQDTANISNITYVSSNTSVFQLTNMIFMIYPPFFFDMGSTINIIFPPDFDLRQSTNLNVYGLNNISPAPSIKIKPDSIEIINCITNYIKTGDYISFNISNVMNLNNASSQSFFIYIKDSQGYQVAQNISGVNYISSTNNLIINTFSPSTKQINQLTYYIIDITISTLLPNGKKSSYKPNN